IEDGFLYIALSILLSQAKDLVHVMQIIAITILFFALNIKFGPGILRFVRGLRQDHFSRSNPLSFLLVFIMATVLAGKLVGIEPM
ncbi:hypothetical protein, partial [Pseudomonas protegens]|uniref:hypothetical protein n=1 Tax=Pseudomonas protegens TaxID=380021 RepID=UPI000CD3A548